MSLALVACAVPRGRRGLATLAVWAALAPPAAAIQLQSIATSLAQPVAIANAGDGSGRLFIVERNGVIRIYDGNQVLPTPFLDISALATTQDVEQGLLGLTFHPDYPATPYFYVDYTCLGGTAGCPADGSTVIARYQVSADPNVADPASAFVILTIGQPESNHNGGQLNFGPADGYLYIAMGDGGGGGDDHGPIGNGQDLTVLLGKILRIDVDNTAPPLNYAIPPTNPFVNSPPARPEIWAYGVRNPWRFTFDRATSDLFIGDVGQACWEEVDFQPASSTGGENYGWRVMEGTHCFDFSNFNNCLFAGCSTAGLTLPILEYSGGCSVIAGYRYRGSTIPSLDGVFLDADFCTGDIHGAVESPPGTWTSTVLLAAGIAISTFGEDESGELYVADFNGGVVYRIVESSSDLSLIKTDSADPAVAGEPLSYTLTVANAGPGAASAVTVTDTLPAGVSYIFSAPAGACASAAGTVTCSLGSIAAGDTGAVRITVTVDLTTSGTISNVATVTSGSPDPDPANNAAAEDTAVVAGDSGLVELSHGSDQVHDLAALSAVTADRDYYRIGQSAWSSYEVVVDAASGDLGPGVELQRIDGDAVTVLQSGTAVTAGLDMARSLRWTNPSSAEVDHHFIRVAPAPGACSTDCGPDDVYRIRAFETTYSIPRFNNAGTQVTVLVVQNPGSYAIAGDIVFWSSSGGLLAAQSFSLPARATLVLNTATVPGVNGSSGTITIASDGRYGDLSGKTVALEPSTGFSFDSPMLPRPR